MIPAWILTVLHYVSLAAAVAVTALIGWQYLRPNRNDGSTGTEGGQDDSAENG
jgi:hypothetical protein